MAQLDLRPLTIGEILDRTFTIYRRQFLLFIGISAVPQILVLAVQLAKSFFFTGVSTPDVISHFALGTILVSAIVILISFVATLFSEAATILAVTDLYLSRPVTIADSLRRAWSEIGTVFGVGILNGLAVMAGALLLVFPGIYILCRLSIAVPVAIVEQRGPQDALRRSWNLTKENTGRSFLLLLLYFVISFAAGLLIGIPFSLAIMFNKDNPGALQVWTAIAQAGNALLNILVIPILLIATSVFYFDLRVRKEAFDLQFMMDPNSERVTPPGSGSVPSIL